MAISVRECGERSQGTDTLPNKKLENVHATERLKTRARNPMTKTSNRMSYCDSWFFEMLGHLIFAAIKVVCTMLCIE